MHMGGLGIIGSRKPKNFRHIVLNNGAHDSVGGQPTIGRKVDIPAIALSCGYGEALSVSSAAGLKQALTKKCTGPLLIEVKVRKGNRKDLGRPHSTPAENKKALMGALNG
jgi:phosphonopyruvate decarboxylase